VWLHTFHQARYASLFRQKWGFLCHFLMTHHKRVFAFVFRDISANPPIIVYVFKNAFYINVQIFKVNMMNGHSILNFTLKLKNCPRWWDQPRRSSELKWSIRQWGLTKIVVAGMNKGWRRISLRQQRARPIYLDRRDENVVNEKG